MERTQLEYFVAIVDHGGFSRAAAALHVAQPSLSRAIQKFERELGVRLFHRNGPRIAPTDAGAMLVQHARLVLRNFDALADAAGAVAEGPAGQVDVAASPSAVVQPLPAITRTLRTWYPEVTMSIVAAASSAEVLALLRQGRCEVGICGQAERPEEPGVAAHPLGEMELLVVLPPSWPAVPGQRIEPSALADTPFIVTPPPTAIRTYFDRLASRVPGMRIAVEAGHREAILPMVLAGVGAAILPDSWHPLASRSGAIVCRMSEPERLPIWLVHRAGVLTLPARALIRAALFPVDSDRQPSDEDSSGSRWAAGTAAAVGPDRT